jgi:hypothetical protein
MQDFRNKRQRGRGRKPGGGGHHNSGGGGGGGGGHHHSPNRTLESNGPDMKVRGPASHIFERYLQLARDANSSGDRVMSENYLQHAEHYFRLLRQMQPTAPAPQQADRYNTQQESDGDEDGQENEGSNGVGENNNNGNNGNNNGGNNNEAADSGDQPDVEFPAGQQQQNFDRNGPPRGDGRRGRRGRYRPEGEREGGDVREGGPPRESAPRDAAPVQAREERAERPPQAERQDRPERQERRERAPREPRPAAEGEQNGGDEGFSNSPRPAFLRSD